MMEKKGIHSHLIFWLSTLVLLFLDQWSKQLVVAHLKGKSALSIIENIFCLQYLENQGAAFGILQGKKVYFVVLTLIFFLRQVNDLCYEGSHRLREGLLATGKFEPLFEGKPFIKEFVLKPLCDVKALQQALSDAGFFAALETEEGYVSFCVTEKRTRGEIDALIEVVKGL